MLIPNARTPLKRGVFDLDLQLIAANVKGYLIPDISKPECLSVQIGHLHLVAIAGSDVKKKRNLHE